MGKYINPKTQTKEEFLKENATQVNKSQLIGWSDFICVILKNYKNFKLKEINNVTYN